MVTSDNIFFGIFYFTAFYCRVFFSLITKYASNQHCIQLFEVVVSM